MSENRFAFIDEKDRAAFKIMKPAELSSTGHREAAVMALMKGAEVESS